MSQNPETDPLSLVEAAMRPNAVARATSSVSPPGLTRFILATYARYSETPLIRSSRLHPRVVFPGYLPTELGRINKHRDKPAAVRLCGAVWSFGILSRALPEGARHALSKMTMRDAAQVAGVADKGQYDESDVSKIGQFGLECAEPYLSYFNTGMSRFTVLPTRGAALSGIGIPFAALVAFENDPARNEMRSNVAAGHLRMPLINEIEAYGPDLGES